MGTDRSDSASGPPPGPVWVCPVCKEPIDQHDRIAVSRHHDWHRLVERQQSEREAN